MRARRGRRPETSLSPRQNCHQRHFHPISRQVLLFSRQRLLKMPCRPDLKSRFLPSQVSDRFQRTPTRYLRIPTRYQIPTRCQKIPTRYQRTPTRYQIPIRCQKIPARYRKTPTRSQGVPTHCQKIPTRRQRIPARCQRTPIPRRRIPIHLPGYPAETRTPARLKYRAHSTIRSMGFHCYRR